MAATLIADFFILKIMENKEQNRDFKGVWIPKEIWLNHDLNPAEKCLLAEIDSLDNSEEKGCFASNEYLGKFIGISEGSCANLISSLKKRQHLVQVFFDGRNRGLRLNKNMKSKKEISQNNESRVNKNMKAEPINPLKQDSQNNEHSNTSINTYKNTIIDGEETPPTNESDLINLSNKEWKIGFDDDVPFSGDGMVDFLKWQMEKEKPEIENKANNLPLEEKKEIRKKVAAKKEKKEKPQLKTMIECYPDEESFVNAWGLRFGAKYPKVDASKGYNRILLYCETKDKLYADYVRVLFVWYTGEDEAKRKSYEYDAPKKETNMETVIRLQQGAGPELW